MQPIRLLFLTDMHLGESDAKYESKERDLLQFVLKDMLREHREHGHFDAILIGGDFIDTTWAASDAAHKTAEESLKRTTDDAQRIHRCKRLIDLFFTDFSEHLFSQTGLPPSRVLLIPGNHDEKSADVLDHLFSASKKYGFSSGEFSRDEDKYTAAHVDFSNTTPPLDLAVSLFFTRCHPDATPGNADLPTEQLKQVADQVAESTSRDVPCLALLHHHLLPQPKAAEADSTEKSRALNNAGQVLAWLQKHAYFAAFHGHSHFFSCVSHHHHDHVSISDRKAGSGATLHVIGGDSLLSFRKPSNQSCSYLTVDISRIRGIQPPQATVTRHLFLGDRFSKEPFDIGHSLRHRFAEAVYREETFLAPEWARPSAPADVWFWQPFNAFVSKMPHISQALRSCGDESDSADGKNDVFDAKVDALAQVLQAFRKFNRKQGLVFSAHPAQLDRVYNLGSLYFSPSESLEAARREFGAGKVFIDLIQLSRWEKEITNRNRNHLDWANVIIANELGKHLKHVAIPRIVEGGFGGLCTLGRLAEAICNPRDESFVDGQGQRTIEYLGLEVAPTLVGDANTAYNSKVKTNATWLLQDVVAFDNGNVFVEGDMFQYLVAENRLAQNYGSVDAFIASYSFHHVFSSKRIVRTICSGELHRYFVDEPTEMGGFLTDISGGKSIFKNVLKPQSARRLADWIREGQRREGEPLPADVTNRIKDCFFDRQEMLLERVYELLKDGGLLCLADPNGFSASFNRMMIFEDPLLAASYFNDFAEAAALLERKGFAIERLIRQVRLQDNSVSNIDISVDRASLMSPAAKQRWLSDVLLHDNESRKNGEYREHLREYLQEPATQLDYSDIHLGYVIIARKLAPDERGQHICQFAGLDE